LVRDHTHIPVAPFDGVTIPHAAGSFDTVLFVDVLHHTADPMVLLREARRVTRQSIVIKDHLRDGFFAGMVLGFMDWVGNKKHGVVLPYNYWSRQQWLDAFQELGLTIVTWMNDLKLYPVPADWVFGRSLHFIARLDVGETKACGDGAT
jgi:SAM-dependent methyltransferase